MPNINPLSTNCLAAAGSSRRSKKFAAAVDFIARFREYSPFNNMLVFLQNPLATYFATASHWHKVFRRTIKDEARGMVILAPRTPVLMVYDHGRHGRPAAAGQTGALHPDFRALQSA